MLSLLHRLLASLLLLTALPLAAAWAQVGPDGYLAPLTLVDSRGEILLGEDWRLESPFCVLLLVDRAAEGDYALDELEMTRRLSEWGELEPGFLAVREVYVVPGDGPETRHEYGPRHLRVQVRGGVNRGELLTWLPTPRGRLVLIGGGGRALGEWEAADGRGWDGLGRRFEEALGEFEGPPFELFWERVVAAEASWRLGIGALVRWRREVSAAELAPELAPLADLSHTSGQAEAGALRLGVLLLLAARAEGELEDKLARGVLRSRLYKISPEARLAKAWYEVSRGPDPGALAELLDAKRGRLEVLVALRRLCLRSETLAAAAVALLGESRPQDWEERAQALRYLAELHLPGLSLAGDEPRLALALPEPPGIEAEPRWQVRLAWAEALAGVPRRSAVQALLVLLESEGNARVLGAALESLHSLTGMRFGVRVDRWRQWLDERGADWRPAAPERVRWLPEPDLRDLSSTEATTGSFVTDLGSVLFALDVSGSMRDGLAREVEHALERQLELFAADARVGLMLFAERAIHRETRPQLRAAETRVKEDLLRFYSDHPKQGRTDIEAGLRAAFEYEDLEELFLATDGFPTEGELTSLPALVELVDRLNLHRRVRINALLLRVGGQYFEEDLKGAELPEPTDEERRAWAAELDELYQSPDLSLLHALAAYHGGRTRLAFGNQLYSRHGAPGEEQ